LPWEAVPSMWGPPSLMWSWGWAPRGGRQRFEPTPISWGEAALSGDTRSLCFLLLHMILHSSIYVVLCWSRGYYSPSPGLKVVSWILYPVPGSLAQTYIGRHAKTCMHPRARACTQLHGKRRRQKLGGFREGLRARGLICSGHTSPRTALRCRDGGRVHGAGVLAAGRRASQRTTRPQQHRHGHDVLCGC